MKSVASHDVFVSYASSDGVVAMRISEDLRRSGLRVWRYEADRQIGVDFQREFEERIRDSRWFCLLDSKAARRSQYVMKECQIMRERQAIDGLPDLVICIVEPAIDDWRKTELFEGQNRLSYIDLTDYDTGIQELCHYLEITYCPDFRVPRDQDFKKELFASKIPKHEIKWLVDFYAEFRRKYQTHKEVAEKYIWVLIDKLECLDATDVISPYFALGVLKAEMGRHEAAAKTFGSLVEMNPEDPRAWHGLGGALFHLGECTKALAAYERCKRLLNEGSELQRSSHIVDVIHNIGRVLLALGKPEQAWVELDALSEKESREPNILALRGKILFAQKRPYDAVGYFEQAVWPYLNEQTQPLSYVCDLADCYLALGRVHDALRVLFRNISACEKDAAFCRKLAEFALHFRDYEKAMTFLKKAVDLEPESIQDLAELASIKYCIGDMDEAVLYAKRCRDLKPNTAQDRYYRGLAFFILGKREAAEEERIQAERDNIIGSWPDYKYLFKDQSRKTTRRQPLGLEAAISTSWIQRLLQLNERQRTKHLKPGCLRKMTTINKSH